MVVSKLKQTMTANWTIDTSHMVNRHQAKTLLRRYPAEVAACVNNLQNVLVALCQGMPVNAVPFSFFRPEGGGVFRIGQTGVPSAREMRLYVTFVFVRGVAYILSIGTKNTQSRDIADSIRAAQQIRKGKP